MTVWTPNDDGQADLSSHDSFVNGPPLATFARMRRENPVAWCEFAGQTGYWSITRHADILTVNRDFATFSSARGIRMEDQTYEEYLARRTFQETDPPEHSRTRMLVGKAFSRPVVGTFEALIRKLCTEILDEAFAGREIDGVNQVARKLPMRLLGQIIGTREEDLDWLVTKGDQLMANSDEDFTDHVVDKVDTDAYRLMPFRSPAGAELYDYASRLMADKHAAGDTSGVLNLILEPDANGDRISETEFKNFFCLLVAAGNDTTRYSIAAGLQALAHQPELLPMLKEGRSPEQWELMADEFIRWAAPATYFRRTATRDVEMHGRTIREGDKVLLWFVSGNRDETVFAEPNRVNIARTPNRHLSFGQGGPHVCLGMWLAKLEVKIIFQEIAKRLKAIEPNGPQAFVRSNFVGGIKRLPLRFTLQ